MARAGARAGRSEVANTLQRGCHWQTYEVSRISRVTPAFWSHLPLTRRVIKISGISSTKFGQLKPRKINKMTEFYMIIARKIFFPIFIGGGGTCHRLLRFWKGGNKSPAWSSQNLVSTIYSYTPSRYAPEIRSQLFQLGLSH